MISDALDDLYETLHDPAVAGEQVTYVSDSGSVVVFAVLEKAAVIPPNMQGLQPGQFDFASSNPKNIDHDFSVMAADLVIKGLPVTPVRGHLIKRTFGGSTKVYELMASTGAGALWEWQDGYDKRMLIHTKFVRTE